MGVYQVETGNCWLVRRLIFKLSEGGETLNITNAIVSVLLGGSRWVLGKHCVTGDSLI